MRFPLQKSRIEPLNRCDRAPFQAIRRRFSLSQRERVGVREGRWNEHVVRFMGRESRSNKNVVRFMGRKNLSTVHSRDAPLRRHRCSRTFYCGLFRAHHAPSLPLFSELPIDDHSF
jgi:hypothetical protein